MGTSQQRPAATSSNLCPRCKQPVTFQDKRCPGCGQPLAGFTRNLTLWIGLGGVGAILFVVMLMWLVVRNDDLVKAPLPVDEETAPVQPDFPRNRETRKKKRAAQEKKRPPPLNRKTNKWRPARVGAAPPSGATTTHTHGTPGR